MALGSKEITKTKINYLYVASFADKNVFDFEVSMNYAVSMAIVQCTGNLPPKLAGLFFPQASMGNAVIGSVQKLLRAVRKTTYM
jgi:hypothetical protein